MSPSNFDGFIIGPDDLVLVTGATGFIGSRLVQNLLDRGLRHVRCFARTSSKVGRLQAICSRGAPGARVEIFEGNLLSSDDCAAATKDAAVIFHLAAGRGEKSVPDAFLNSVVTTRNLLEAALANRSLRRFVGMSSFSVYGSEPGGRRLLDETSPVEGRPELRGDAYTFAKVKQDEMLAEYGRDFGVPYVIVRPGYVYGPGNLAISGRVGIDTFGVFLHLGGSNRLPLTYIDNCLDAIALAGLQQGVDGEVFNVVDDDVPSSRQFLRLYKRNVRHFRSVYVPHAVSYALCAMWERYSTWSERQLEPVFNRRAWRTYWRAARYTNRKLKDHLGWTQRVPTAEGLQRYFEACRAGGHHA